MNQSGTNPSRWRYLIGTGIILIAVVTCGIISLVQVNAFVPSTRFVVPGTHQIYLGKDGKYVVYHEYRSAVDGKTYVAETSPSSMTVRIESASSGESKQVSTPSGSTNYSTPKYRGRSVLEFSISEPGEYTFSADYVGSAEGPDVVLSVGQSSALRLVLTVLGIILGTFVVIGIGVFIIVRTFLRRKNAARAVS